MHHLRALHAAPAPRLCSSFAAQMLAAAPARQARQMPAQAAHVRYCGRERRPGAELSWRASNAPARPAPSEIPKHFLEAAKRSTFTHAAAGTPGTAFTWAPSRPVMAASAASKAPRVENIAAVRAPPGAALCVTGIYGSTRRDFYIFGFESAQTRHMARR